MSGSEKVGDLFAELGIKDNLTKPMEKAGAKFKSDGKSMVADAKIGLDDKQLESGLGHAKQRMKEGASKGMEGMHDAVASAMGPLGEQLSVGLGGLGALGGAALYKGITGSMDRQAGAAKLGAQLGLDPATAQKLGQQAGGIYAQNYGDSLGEVNDAVKLATQNIGGLGNMTKDEFDSMIKNALNVKSVFEQDLSKSTSAVGQLIRTGLVKDSTEGFDLITKGLQGPSNKADDLLDTFNEYSTMFRSLGLDGQTSLGLINQGVTAGARDSDVAADSLKEFSIRVRDGSTTTADGFTKLGLNAKDAAKVGVTGLKTWAVSAKDVTNMLAQGGPKAKAALQMVLDKLRDIKDPTQQAAIATELFGTQSEDMQKALLAFDPSKAVESLGQVQGAAKSVNDEIGDTNSSKVETFKREMGAKFNDFIANDVIPAAQNLGKAWTDNIGTADDFQHGLTVLHDGWTDNIGTMNDFQHGQSEIGDWWRDHIGTMDDFHNGVNKIGDAFLWVGDKIGWVKDHVLDPVVGTIQSILGMIDDVGNKVASLPGGDAIKTVVGGPLGGLLGFDDGGTVPGPVGAPRLVVVHGGETILPTHKTGTAAATTTAAPMAAGTRHETTIVQLGRDTLARHERRRTLAAS